MWILLLLLIATPAYATTNNNIAAYIREVNPDVPEKEVKQICTAIGKWSKHFTVPQNLIASVIAVESHFNKNVAGGLMQVRPHIWMPELKKNKILRSWRDLKTIDGNIKAGTYILKYHNLNVKKYNGGGDKHYKRKVKRHELHITRRAFKRK